VARYQLAVPLSVSLLSAITRSATVTAIASTSEERHCCIDLPMLLWAVPVCPAASSVVPTAAQQKQESPRKAEGARSSRNAFQKSG
jgi:hypothetical protein